MAGREIARSSASRRGQPVSSARLLTEGTWSPSTGGRRIRCWRRLVGLCTPVDSTRSGTTRPLRLLCARLRTRGSCGRAPATLRRTITRNMAPSQTGWQTLKGSPDRTGRLGRLDRTGRIGDRRPRCTLITRRRRSHGSSFLPIIRRGPGPPLERWRRLALLTPETRRIPRVGCFVRCRPFGTLTARVLGAPPRRVRQAGHAIRDGIQR
jgi:hypothetical protein